MDYMYNDVVLVSSRRRVIKSGRPLSQVLALQLLSRDIRSGLTRVLPSSVPARYLVKWRKATITSYMQPCRASFRDSFTVAMPSDIGEPSATRHGKLPV